MLPSTRAKPAENPDPRDLQVPITRAAADPDSRLLEIRTSKLESAGKPRTYRVVSRRRRGIGAI